MKRNLTIVLIAAIAVLVAYIVFREYQFAKLKTPEGVSKPKPDVSETKESDLKKREEIY